MNCRARRVFLLGLAVGLLSLTEFASAAPLVTIQLLARPDGTDQPFSGTITATTVGEEFDWIVVATLAPAGTTNINLPVDANGKQQIGSWQYNTNTGASDGLGGVLYSLFASPTTTTQVSFQNPGFMGATAGGGHAGIDPSVANGLTTSLNNAGNFGNASYSGGVQTSNYTYATQTGTQTPSGISRSAAGNALWRNFAAYAGTSGGTLAERSSSGNTNNDLTNVLAIAGAHNYVGIDDGTVDTSGTNQQPVTMILESGSQNYYDTASGSSAKVDSTFVVTSLGAGSSTLNINSYDTNPGFPYGDLLADTGILNLQYHDTAGNLVRPGPSGVLQYSDQFGPDPVVQFVGLAVKAVPTNGGPVAAWTQPSGGDWSSPQNWQGGVVANAANTTADFSENFLAANMTIHLDSSQTVGSIIFGDEGNTYNTTLDNNGNPSNILTLSVSSGTPTIGVASGAATISAGIVSQTGSVAIAGEGTLILTGNGISLLSGTAVTIDSGATLAFHPGIAGNYSLASTGTSLAAVSGSTFDMADGAVKTLTIQRLTAAGATFVFGLGNTANDELVVAGAATASGANFISVVPPPSGGLAPSPLTLISAAAGSTLDGGSYEFGDGASSEIVAIGASVYQLTLSSSPTQVQLSWVASTGMGWSNPNGGVWNPSTPANWFGGGVPQNPADVAVFGPAIGATNQTVTITSSVSVGLLLFINGGAAAGGNYTIAASGGGTLTFNSNGNGASITNQFGNNTITAPIVLADTLQVATSGGTTLTLGPISAPAATTIAKQGGGVLEIDAPPALPSGSAIEVNQGTLRFNSASASPSPGSAFTTTVAAGATLELAGNAAALSLAANVVNNSNVPTTGGLYVTGTNQVAGVISGSGDTVVAAGASLSASQLVQNSLTIHGTGVVPSLAGMVTLVPSGSGSTANPTGPNNINFSSTLTSLSIDNDGGPLGSRVYYGTLDIGNNGLVIAYGSGPDPYATIDDMILSGYDAGSWNGTGITSSLARAATNSITKLNIGLLDFTPGTGNYSNTTFISFEGQTVTTNAILVRLTYMDDFVLAGDMLQSDADSDALLFAANYGSGTTWNEGDLDHDGVIDTSDALVFDANFRVGLLSLDGTTGNPAALTGDTAAVPEPGGLLLGLIGAVVLRGLFRRPSAPGPNA